MDTEKQLLFVCFLKCSLVIGSKQRVILFYLTNILKMYEISA